MHFVDAKSILSPRNGMNVYRGCSHGCIYCDSRSKCYHFTHAFEDIEVKQNAPDLLEKALKSKRKKCMIGTGSMSDPYMHCEKDLQITRKCLEVIEKYGFGATVLTKSDLVLRDLDLLEKINKKAKCVVQMTITTYDEEMCKKIEPNVCTTQRRLEVLKIMHEHQIPTVVWLCPILPFINDTKENLENILEACIEAKVHGILCFAMGLTLREGNREYFYEALNKNFPGLRGEYHRTYGYQYELNSKNNTELMKIFYRKCSENGILCKTNDIFTYLNEFPDKEQYCQLRLF